MLTRLSVKNLAVVADVSVTFGPRLNVISGETGAGKSLLIGALGLAVGDRAQASWVREGTDRARVEAHFTPVDGPRVDAGLAAHGLDPMEDGWISLRREVTADGKSRAFVGDVQVRVSTLRSIGDLLVDRHGQREQVRVLSPSWQRDCLDALAGADDERRKLADRAEREQKLTAEIDAIHERHDRVTREREFYEHQLREIDAAELSVDEEERLRAEQRLMSQSSRLVESARIVIEELVGADAAGLDRLDRASRALDDLVAVDEALAPMVDLLGSARVEVEEVATSVRRRVDTLEFSEERRDEIEGRLDLVNRLKRKYGRSIEEILTRGEEVRAALQADANAEIEAASAVAEREAIRAAMAKTADSLRRKRESAAKLLTTAVHQALPDLGMGGATFEVATEPILDDDSWFVRGGKRLRLGPAGADRIHFRLAANPGQTPKPLGDAASGGETSRLMLVLRVLLSEAGQAEVQVLDEVDSGIGGKTARSVGAHIRRLAAGRQVIAITHLAAVACHAEHHHRIDKAVIDEEASIAIETLDAKARVSEIARMLSGGADDATARRHARELLKQVQGA